MKKNYITPASDAVRLNTEGLMATSLTIGGQKEDGTEETIDTEGGVLSNGNGNYSSDYWNGVDD